MASSSFVLLCVVVGASLAAQVHVTPTKTPRFPAVDELTASTLRKQWETELERSHRSFHGVTDAEIANATGPSKAALENSVTMLYAAIANRRKLVDAFIEKQGKDVLALTKNITAAIQNLQKAKVSAVADSTFVKDFTDSLHALRDGWNDDWTTITFTTRKALRDVLETAVYKAKTTAEKTAIRNSAKKILQSLVQVQISALNLVADQVATISRFAHAGMEQLLMIIVDAQAKQL